MLSSLNTRQPLPRAFARLTFLFFWFYIASYSASLLAADEKIVVYTYLNGHHANQSADFRAITKKSLNSLRKFKVSNSTKGRISSKTTIEKRLSAASKVGIPWVADVAFDSEKKEGKLTFQIFKSNGENIFHWSEELDIDSVKAFMANLEYNMPIKLKTKFLELGRVIKKEDRIVYFDLGDTAGVKIGDTFRTYELGDEIEDDDGNSYGYLEVPTGIVKVTEIKGMYSIAEVIIGRLSIEADHFIKRTAKADGEFDAKILSVLENQIAINIGKSVGVEEDSYYAVFRDIKQINKKDSFRQPVGHIKINEVFDVYAKGELSVSDTYELTKFTIKKGDSVEEIESPRKNMWSINQVMTNITKDGGSRILHFAYQRDSQVNINMVYRLKGGYENGQIFVAGGIMHSLNHSSHVYAGLDVLYIGDSALNMFLSVDVDTPLSNNLMINLETGYIIGHTDDIFNGLNTSVGLKYAFDLF